MSLIRTYHLTFIVILATGLASCIPNEKLIYMQALADSSALVNTSSLVPYRTQEYLLQYHDIVDITMKTTSTELNEILAVNDNDNQIRNMGGLNSGDAFFLNGYTLDDKGFVELPLVGHVRLVGMNMNQAKDAIEEKLKTYVTEDNYYVRVRLGGVRYSALGEFNRPGKFTVLQNRVTIFDAIANAGDMTSLAKRTEVKIIRQYPDGSRTHTVNLLSDKILESEFLFLQPNDVIYAKPMKVKQLGTGTTAVQSFQVGLSLITVILLFINVTN